MALPRQASCPPGKTPGCPASAGLTGNVCQAQEGRSPLLNVDFSAPSLQKAFGALADSAERKKRLSPRGRMDLASPGPREGKVSNIPSPVAVLLPQSNPTAVPPLLPGCHQG
ncbi:unnamed protein product [Coccothraustes coccothraustes]